MKSSIWLLLAIPPLYLTAESVRAEGGCPQGQTPTQFGAVMGCAPGGNDSPEQENSQAEPPRPVGYWEKTWGAIAPSSVGGVLGTAVGARSKQEAERLALADCRAKGGGACEVRIAYYNQCAVMALGDRFYRTASAGSVSAAKKLGIKLCSKDDTNCRIYYSGCTEPIFHSY